MVLIYSQNWSAGAFARPHWFAYDVAGGSTMPGYPDVVAGEAIKTIDGAGPNGERVLDVDVSGGEDPQVSGIWVEIPRSFADWGADDTYPYNGSPGINEAAPLVPKGVFEVDYYFTPAGIAGNNYGPVVNLADYNGYPGALQLDWDYDAGGSFWFRHQIWDTGYARTSWESVSYNAAFFTSKWVRFRIAWDMGTFTGTTGNGDGFMRVTAVPYVGNALNEAGAVTLFNHTGINPLFGWIEANSEANKGLISGYWLGYYGLMGQATNIALYSVPPPPPPPPVVTDDPPVDVTTAHCGNPPSGVPSPPNPPAQDNPIVPGVTDACAGTGLGPNGTNPGAGEVWLY